MKLLNVFGLTIFSLGALALIAFGFYKAIGPFLIESEIPFIVKSGIIALILGVIIILISLVFERVKEDKK